MSGIKAQAIVEQAARDLTRVIQGFLAVFKGGPTTTVNNGIEELPSLSKVIADGAVQFADSINTATTGLLAQSNAALAATQQAAAGASDSAAEADQFADMAGDAATASGASAATAATAAAAATMQANNAAASGDVAATAAAIATAEAGLATTAATSATEQAVIATAASGTATNQANIATTQAVLAANNAGLGALALSYVSNDAPPGYPRLGRYVLDSNNKAHVVSEIFAAAAVSHIAPAPNLLTAYAKTADLPFVSSNDLPPGYGRFIRGFVDTANRFHTLVDIGATTAYVYGGDDGGAASGVVFSPPPKVWDVFLLAPQQSNGAGKGEGPYVTPLAGTALAWNSIAGTLRALTDPFPENPGLGSMWPQFGASYWAQDMGAGSIVVPAFEGGTSINFKGSSEVKRQSGEYWDFAPNPVPANTPPYAATSQLVPRAIARLNACIAYLNANSYCWRFAGMIARIGETDALAMDAGQVSEPELKASWVSVIGQFRAVYGNDFPVHIIRTGSQYTGISPNFRNDTAGWQAQRRIEEQIARELPNCTLADTAAFNFPINGGALDGVHWNQNALNGTAKRLAPIAALWAGSN